MAVHFKFKSAKDFDSVPINGHFISVGSLKRIIFESKKLCRGRDFDLMISNAQTDEEYADEKTLIPKNTSVLVRRVPGHPQKPIIIAPPERKVEERVDIVAPSINSLPVNSSVTRFPPEESEWDEFGDDLYSVPEIYPVQPVNRVQDAILSDMADEDSKIKALVDTPALDWQRKTQDGYGSGRGFDRGVGGRMSGGRGFGRGLEHKTPPHGYICYRCNIPGHFIQHCPTNGDPNYDIKRVKPPTGIPKSMLMETPDGSFALPSGAVAVLKPNESAFEKEMEGLPTTCPIIIDFPPELRCPVCKQAMKDAVITSKCCCRSFCDKCIRDHILSKFQCVCGAANVLADDLLPNKTLRETIDRMLESSSSSAENTRSFPQVQDLVSARPSQPKAPSPTLSAPSSKKRASDDIAANIPPQSAEKKTSNGTDQSGVTLDSISMKVRTSQGGLPSEDDQRKPMASKQGKMKKRKTVSTLATLSDMQRREDFEDYGAEAIPLGQNGYNPYWGGHANAMRCGSIRGVSSFHAIYGPLRCFIRWCSTTISIRMVGVMNV